MLPIAIVVQNTVDKLAAACGNVSLDDGGTSGSVCVDCIQDRVDNV